MNSVAKSSDSLPPSSPAAAPAHGLRYFPVPLFAAVMGWSGISLAWRRAAHTWEQVPTWPAQAAVIVASTLFVVFLAFYVAKGVRYPRELWAEMRHPVRMAFVPAITISFLLIATASYHELPQLASYLWWIGAVGHLVATGVILSSWFQRPDIQNLQVTPAWYIPIVGNVITPLAAKHIGNVELAWFSFGLGVVFWVALLPLLLGRVLIAEAPLPQKLLPSLAIFIAPPSVIALSWVSLGGSLRDPFGHVLVAAAWGFTVLVLAQANVLRRVPFALPYWAYTFPFAAVTVLTIAYSHAKGSSMIFSVLGVALLAFTTLVVLTVSVLTARAAMNKKICVPE